ncbi:MAG: PQQ-binding-like beta-propeller repeat protein [Planctomycetes bacterium]|nr:PQQ-binding-like beta-propeller repeat protein [Planctomycetota bacterium]
MSRILRKSLLLFTCAPLLAAAPAAAEDPNQLARQIYRETGVEGGLVVHLACGDGKLTVALRADDRYLVHGLDAAPANVEEARQRVQAAELCGHVTIEHWTEASLPYADDLVNLLVAEDLGDVPKDEVMRVLSPLGAAYIKLDGRWTTLRKPWPETMDEWTHFLHDASNNAVAADSQVGPPGRLRWVCGPLWSRSHEFNSSLCAMVSAKGRIFYIFDEGLTGVTTPTAPERWTLIARDAFNGLLLWKRSVPKWGAGHWNTKNLRSAPPTVPRRLVAEEDRLFVTLGYDAPVSALDAATGETLTTYDDTDGTQEIRIHQGILVLRKGGNLVRAIDAKTGKTLWETTGKIQSLSLALQGDRVFYQDGPSLLSRRLGDGEELWRAPSKRPVSLLLAHEDRLLLLSGPAIHAVSSKTGKSLWTVNAGIRRRELFVANGQLWHWEGDRIVGRDLETGAVSTRPDTDDVFTPGHHLRCYQTKATKNFLITPNRGIEFVSVTGAANTQHDWVRGPCRYGVMPSNGLLYAGPDPCFCYPGVKLTGFNALAPKRNEGRAVRGEEATTPRLQRGPAYQQNTVHHSSFIVHPSGDWPTYRHDPRRTGATSSEVPARVVRRWRVPLAGRPTPPVVSGDHLYVAARDHHRLYALDVDDGRELWRFTAAGRIDSPPSVCGKLVLFGCADGHVYCLRASDGALVWRFRAAPSPQRIVAFGQLESPWRVHGNVLIDRGVAYCTAGRSSYLDGGIRLFGLDPKTGNVLHEACIDTWARTRKDAENKPFIPAYHMEGALSDILVSQGDSIYLGQVRFDRALVQQEVPYILADANDKTVPMDLSNQPFVAPDAEPDNDYETHQRDWLERTQAGLLRELRQKHGSHNMGDRNIGLHVFSTAGFLDDTWFNRTFWTYSATWPGFYLAHRAAKTGQLLVVGPEKTFAVQAFPSRNLQSPLFTPGEKGYLLFADRNDNQPVLDYRTRGTTKGWGFTRMEPPEWHDWVPVRIRAMVLAKRRLFVAGPPDVVDPDDLMGAFEGRKGAVLRTHSAADGKTLAQLDLDAPPVFDGLIAAGGRLFMSTTDGHVVCYGAER